MGWCYHRVLTMGRGNAEREQCKQIQLATASCEDGGRGHRPRNAPHGLLEAGKGKDTDSPLEPPEGISPSYGHLGFSPGRPLIDS